jgi:hypothetical protein
MDGLCPKNFKDPHTGVQFQFSISKEGAEFGIWIDGWPEAGKAKRNAQQKLINSFDGLPKLLRKLPRGYYVGLYNRRNRKPICEWNVTEVRNSAERLRFFLTRMGDREVHVTIAIHLSRTEAIRHREGLPRQIARTFDELLPLYSLMIGESISVPFPKITQVRPLVLGASALSERWVISRRTQGRTVLSPLPEREIDKEGARRAEELVSNHERDELRRLGRPDLARRVRDVSKFAGYGYDIQSFAEDGRVIRIEVKSVKAKRFRNFILTSSEWDAACKFGRDYSVCVVLRPRTKAPEILPLPDFAKQVERGSILVEPYTYIARRR